MSMETPSTLPPLEVFSQDERKEKASMILQFIEKKIIGKHAAADEATEQDLRESYKNRTPRERADLLYEKVMAFMLDRQSMRQQKERGEPIDEGFIPELISEIKVLCEDSETQKIASITYADARIDQQIFHLSELGNSWQSLNVQIKTAEQEFAVLEKSLFLKQIKGPTKLSVAKSKTERLAKRILHLKEQKARLENLEELPATPENTDMVAMFQYQKYIAYKEQGEAGFIWLPSREDIHRDTVAALQNGRWPALIGEGGTGKSDQADAAAIELTGYPPTEVACSASTGEIDLIKDIANDPKTGGSYEVYGPLMRAFTGYDDSRQTEPTFKTGRIVRFDEFGRLGPKAYAIIKAARQKKPGDDFYGRPMLPGAAAILTTNPPGLRYPDRAPPDAAMRREIAEINVDYPEQTSERPEEFDFMVPKLFDRNNHFAVAEKELAPAYEKKDIPEVERTKLPDGRVIVAKDELIQDPTDSRHGTLWRLAGAVKALQRSFVRGNETTQEDNAEQLRFIEDEHGVITITDVGGEPLTLSSTITLGELASWMRGFGDRLQKKDQAFQVSTFTEWIHLKLRTYIKQIDKADKAKVEAIFNHFHLFDPAPDLSDAAPITPKRIGYLSPRVPRPLYLEQPRPEPKSEGAPKPLEPLRAARYETTQVLLDNGERVLIRTTGEFTFRTHLKTPLQVVLGAKFMVGNDTYIFQGVVDEQGSPHSGMLVGSLPDEKELHRLCTLTEVQKGIVRQGIKETEELVAMVTRAT